MPTYKPHPNWMWFFCVLTWLLQCVVMWTPLVRLMVALLSADAYKQVVVKVSWGSSAGSIAIYLISPLLISLFGWRSVFLFSAVCGLAGLIFWNKLCCDVKTEPTVKIQQEKRADSRLFTPLMIGIMLAIIMQGMLRDGVTTWMPSYIFETYDLSSVISILTGVVLPVFSIVCFQIASVLYKKKFTNPLRCAGVIFTVGAIWAFALFLFTGQSAALSVLFAALITGAMHGVNLILISMIPPFFQKFGNTSTISGVLNSCTYIGSAVSTYGIAVLSKIIGWHYTILVWFIIALIGTVLCLICVKPWKKAHP